MNVINFIKTELKNWGCLEKYIFPVLIALVITVSILNNDNKLAVFASACGITYTILAGKGKISCYIIGMCGTLCYAYLAFSNSFYGNCILYALYYFPMEIVGILKWRKHLSKDTKEVIKTRMQTTKGIKLLLLTSFAACICAFILKYTGDKSPFLDSFAAVFSVLGMYLTVKRCIEQWYIWFFVNLLSLIMWYYAYIQGAKMLSVLLMWIIYLCLSVYFWYNWNRQLNNKRDFEFD